MLTKKLAAANKLGMILVLLMVALGSAPSGADSSFHLRKNSEGLIEPFKANAVALGDFVREFANLTDTQISFMGSFKTDLTGTVTLYVRHPLKLETFKELFHRVLNDNGYAVVDASAGNGWVIQRLRDARDLAIPLYEIADVPDSARYVTAVAHLKYESAEPIARTMRSFMPANSRIIPVGKSQLFITDTASNIRKLRFLISEFDTPDAKKADLGDYSPPKNCGEQHIEKLVVEKLEIHDSSNSPNPISNSSVPHFNEGIKK